jgi:PAS domain S-box-containing protein
VQTEQSVTQAEPITALPELAGQVAASESLVAERDRLAHELSVHQIELEAQNLELRDAQRLLEQSRDRYADLYDFAPICYATLDASGLILEINLTGARMLGVERSRIIGSPFSAYVAESAVGAFRGHLRHCGRSQGPVTGELQMMVKGAPAIQVQLVSLASRDPEGGILDYRITLTDVTAYRRAERKAQAEAVLLERTFASLDQAVVVCDASTHTIVKCSAAVQVIFGYAVDEIIGANSTILHVDPAAYEAFQQQVDLVLNSHRIHHTEATLRRKDGSLFPAEVTVTEIRSDAGHRSGLVNLVRDISERKRAEAALRESEERFRLIFEQAAVGVSESSARTGEYLRVNQRYCDIVGYAREELLGRRFLDITHPDDVAASLELMAGLVAGKFRTGSLEKRFCRKDGSIVWTTLTISPMWEEGEEPTHQIGIIEDITERRQAVDDTNFRLAELEAVSQISTALRAARNLDEMLPLLLDLTVEALHATLGSIWLYDDDADVLRPTASQGGSEKDGKSLHPLLKPGEGVVGTVFASGQPCVADDFHLGGGGSEAQRQRMPVGIGGAAIPIHAGEKIIGTFMVNVSLPRRLTPGEVRLLTTLSEIAGTAIQRTVLHDEVERRAEELEQRVAERTAELTAREAALKTANTQLKELDIMKSQFVSNVSHELRTPITTIKLYATLLRKGPPERREQFLNALEQEANRQAHLIEEILEVSRIESGRLDLVRTTHALNPLVQASMAGRELLAAEKGVVLIYNLSEPGPTVSVDRIRLLEVIDNLIENALWYTLPGGRVSVATGTAEADGHTWATLSVTDTGIGIPQNELPRIFDRFYRGEQPRDQQLPGTGLGLAIVKDIVELHEGRVTVESQLGSGSVFTIWLPLA